MKDQTISANEQRFRALISATSDVIYSLSADWVVMREMDGRGFLPDAHEPTVDWQKQNIPPDETARVSAAIAEAIREKKVFQLEHRVNRADGSIGWTSSRAIPILNEQGEIIEWFGTASDITDRKLAEDALLKTKELAERQKRVYETVTSNTPDLMYVFDLDYRFTYVNTALLAMWGKTWENAVGKSLLENGYEPWHAEMHEREIDQIVANKQSVRGEVAFPHATLGRRVYDYILTPVLNELGEVEAVAGTTRDITDRKDWEDSVARSSRELKAINEELANANREQTAANEEMAAVNEELAVINEELTETQTHLQATFSELTASKERFRFLLNAIPQQVWTALPDGQLNYVSDVVCQDFGADSEFIIGQGWQSFIHPDDFPACINKWMMAIKTGKEYAVEFRLRFNDGQYHWHFSRAVPLIEDGNITLWVGTNTNIEPQKFNEQRKDEFISIASHELKTPLTSIKAFNQIMQKVDDVEKAKSFMDRSAEHINRLERLINDLLDVTKINSGKLVYDMALFDFSQMLSDTVDNNRHLTTKQKITLKDNAPAGFVGDRLRLEQVINNFISNAIKYAPQSEEIIVSSQLDGNNLIVSVQDFGIGIAPENLDKLFDRYYRVDNTAMRFEGLGLGLYISSEILKRHNGSFWIESTPGKGSTFFFLLPVNGKQEFTDIDTDNQTFYEGSFIKMYYRPQEQIMDVDWIGYQNYDSVVKGCLIILDLMQKNQCSLVLNDNTHVQGNWSEAADWGATTWFPDMANAGLRKFAWIYSPSTFSRISASKSVPPVYDQVAMGFFDDVANAKAWLLEKP